MFEFIKDQWEKIVSIIISAVVALVVFYKRFLKVEDQLAQHIADDQELKKDLKTGVEQINAMKVEQVEHKIVLNETRDDVRELKQDVKDILKSLRK